MRTLKLMLEKALRALRLVEVHDGLAMGQSLSSLLMFVNFDLFLDFISNPLYNRKFDVFTIISCAKVFFLLFKCL